MFTPYAPEMDPLDAAANALKTGNVKVTRHILHGVIEKDPKKKSVREMVHQASTNDDELIFRLNRILKVARAIQRRCKNPPVCRQNPVMTFFPK
jgi:hypothetical protein